MRCALRAEWPNAADPSGTNAQISNKTHFARGLVAAVYPAPPGGIDAWDAVTKTSLQWNAGSGMFFDRDQYGAKYYESGAGSNRVMISDVLSGTFTEGSFLIAGKVGITPNIDQFCIDFGATFWMDVDASTYRAGIYGGAGSPVYGSTRFASGDLFIIAGGIVNGAAYCAVNGKLEINGSGISGAQAYGMNPGGNFKDFFVKNTGGSIYISAVSKSAPILDELIKLSDPTFGFRSILFEPANQSPFLISVPAGGGGDIDADFISSASVIYQPSITAGAGTLAADFIGSASAIYQPDVSGTGILEADFVASASQIFDSVLSAGSAGLDADFISSASTVYDPTLEAAGATITADFIASASEVFEPRS